ncbi:MAG: hypothetical protein QNJ44_09765 [Rhodobacter sp.]|nr:hypothetical protein [Rhodobacter sp.]
MGWITLLLYIGVILAWLFLLYQVMAGPKPVPPRTRTNFIILTVIFAILTAMRLFGPG